MDSPFLNENDDFFKSVGITDYGELQKARALPVGTIREWKGKKYQKTAQGWKPAGTGKDKSKQSVFSILEKYVGIKKARWMNEQIQKKPDKDNVEALIHGIIKKEDDSAGAFKEVSAAMGLKEKKGKFKLDPKKIAEAKEGHEKVKKLFDKKEETYTFKDTKETVTGKEAELNHEMDKLFKEKENLINDWNAKKDQWGGMSEKRFNAAMNDLSRKRDAIDKKLDTVSRDLYKVMQKNK